MRTGSAACAVVKPATALNAASAILVISLFIVASSLRLEFLHELHGCWRPGPLRVTAGIAGRQMVTPLEHDPGDVAAGFRQRTLHFLGLPHEMREVLAAMGDQERRRLVLDVVQRAGRALAAIARWPEKARARR